jgi:sugar lactone lactonase YvrE
MTKVEQYVGPEAFHAEGPVWWPGWGGLRYVDMFAGDVVTVSANGEIRRENFGEIAAVVRPRSDGGMVVAIERGFVLVDASGSVEWGAEKLIALEDRKIRMNDGGCDPHGRFYVGSMAYDQTPGAGVLYRLDRDHSIHTILTGVTVSNGLAWSPRGDLAYYVDTPTLRIDVFDYDESTGLTNRRPLVTIDPASGFPDGITVDSEGAIWVALYRGGAVNRYLPDGRLDHRIELPVSQVTACTFGGPAADQLFITTSRENLAADEQPEAGSVYVATVGVAGMPVLPFGG